MGKDTLSRETKKIRQSQSRRPLTKGSNMEKEALSRQTKN